MRVSALNAIELIISISYKSALDKIEDWHCINLILKKMTGFHANVYVYIYIFLGQELKFLLNFLCTVLEI